MLPLTQWFIQEPFVMISKPGLLCGLDDERLFMQIESAAIIFAAYFNVAPLFAQSLLAFDERQK